MCHVFSFSLGHSGHSLLKGLDQLWYDYLSGHLNKVAERYLVTDKMKRKLKLRRINLKTTIEEENYLNCRKVLLESSGEYQCLFSCCNILGRVGNDVCMYYRFDLGPWLSSIFIVPAVCDSNELVAPKSARHKFSLSIRLAVEELKGLSYSYPPRCCIIMFVSVRGHDIYWSCK